MNSLLFDASSVPFELTKFLDVLVIHRRWPESFLQVDQSSNHFDKEKEYEKAICC